MIKRLFYIIIFLLFSTSVFAADVYIDPSGANGDGSFATPYDSLDRVDANFSNANDYYIRCGETDTISDVINITNIVATSGNRMIVGCYYANGAFDRAGCLADSALPIITVSGTADDLIKIQDSDYITLQNLDFQGGKDHIECGGDNDYIKIEYNNIGEDCHGYGIRNLSSGSNWDISYNTMNTFIATYGQGVDCGAGNLCDAIAFVNTDNSDIHHNTITDWGHTAFFIQTGSDNNNIYNNRIVGLTTGHMRAFEFFLGNDNNSFYNNWSYGMTTASKLLGTGNVVHHNIFSAYRELSGETGGAINAGGLNGNTSGNKIYNNTFYDLPGPGIYVFDWPESGYGTVADLEIINNLFIEVGTDDGATNPSNNKDYAIFIDNYDTQFSNFTISNNVVFTTGRAARVIYYRGAGECSVSGMEAQAVSEGDTSANNVASSVGNNMTDPGNDDFTLKRGADSIDAGLSTIGAAYDDGWDPSSSMPPTAVSLLDQDLYGAGWDVGHGVYELFISSALPANNDTGVSATVDPSWLNPTGENTNDGYFKVGACPTDAGDSVWTNQVHKTSYDPGTLAINTVHCWRVDIDHDGGTQQGDDYTFTTTGGPPPTGKANVLYSPNAGPVKYEKEKWDIGAYKYVY